MGLSTTAIAELAFDPSASGHIYALAPITSDAFVTKLNPQGSALIYSTYLGGSSEDTVAGIALNSTGKVFIAGTTISPNFPVAANAPQPALAGGFDGFISEIGPDGNSLLYSTYFGGSGSEFVEGLALDSDGNVAIAGSTSSTDLRVTSGVPQAKLAGYENAFLAAVNPSSGTLVFSTYLGGSGQDAATAVTSLGPGRFCIAGSTNSINFPTTTNAFQPKMSGSEGDAFVAIIDIR
jgi:hypothetical protein